MQSLLIRLSCILITNTGGYNTYNATFMAVASGGPVLKSLTNNLIDEVWGSDTANTQPGYPDEDLLILDSEEYTGKLAVVSDYIPIGPGL